MKVFKDPIYNIISFDKHKETVILDLIDSKEFQRLRRIKQLGLSYFTFPSAVHDRFTHSVGVCYLAGLMLDELDLDLVKNDDGKINIPIEEDEVKEVEIEDFKLLVKLSALLHDIGHGPFSHAFESISGIDHEKISIKILQDESTEINNILRNQNSQILSKFSYRWISDILSKVFIPKWATDIISSQFDADRMDYLLRDAYMCGVKYATFDWLWILNNIELANIKPENRIGVVLNSKKGLHSIESFIISRYHMYEQVYFHKTTRGFEVLAQKIFIRLKELIEEKRIKEIGVTEDHNLIKFFKHLEELERIPEFKKMEKFNLSLFLSLDDYLVTNFIGSAINSSDEILSKLCTCFYNREPFKMIKSVNQKRLWENEDLFKIRDGLKDKFDYFYFEDNYSNTPYKDLIEDGKSENIWLKKDSSISKLSNESMLIKHIVNDFNYTERAYLERDYFNHNY